MFAIREEMRHTTVVRLCVDRLSPENRQIVNITFENHADAAALPFRHSRSAFKTRRGRVFYADTADHPRIVVLYDANDFGPAPLNAKRFPLNDIFDIGASIANDG